MKIQVSPYFLITNNAEKFRLIAEEVFEAKTTYIQRIKDRPEKARVGLESSESEKIDQCILTFGDITIMIADDT